MNFDNNPFIRPLNERAFNPIEALNERVNRLEKIASDNTHYFETDEAQINNLNADESTIKKLTVKETLIDETLINKQPIESQQVVGYDDDGNLIPINAIYNYQLPSNAGYLSTNELGNPKANPSFYDFTVNSQATFNTLMESATSSGGTSYKNIVIVGGCGSGTNGEYEYTVSSDTSDANFNGAKISCFKSAKINITLDDVDSNNISVFKNINKINNVDIEVNGTVLNSNNLYLFTDCKIVDSTIEHGTTPADFIIKNTELDNVINNEYVKFVSCELNECDTVQSYFEKCSSERLYVSTDGNLNKKYDFVKCGIHLDIRKTHVGENDSITITIDSLTETNLTCLDECSELKTLTVNCENPDVKSHIIGNKDVKGKQRFDYSTNSYVPLYKKLFDGIEIEPTPSGINAFVDLGDSSLTPLYTSDSFDSPTFKCYLDSSLSSDKEVKKWKDGSYNVGYTLGNILEPDSSTLFYANLTCTQKKSLNYNSASTESFNPYILKSIPDEYIENDDTITTFVDLKECVNTQYVSSVIPYTTGTNTILYTKSDLADYSDPTAFEVYLDPYLSSTMRIKKWKDGSDNIGYSVGNNTSYYKDLSFTFIAVLNPESATEIPFTPMEISNNKNKYDVKVVIDYDKSVNIKNAFLTSIKND